MYHLIKKDNKYLLLCSGSMREPDFIRVKELYGIDRDQILFVPQELITYIQNKQMPALMKDALPKRKKIKP